MAELSIGSLFSTLCGSNKILDANDVQEGRLDEKIAKELGIINENGDYTDRTYSQEEFEAAIIDNLLENSRKQYSMIKAGQSGDDNSKIIDAFRKFNKDKTKNNGAEKENKDNKTNNNKNTNNPTKSQQSKKSKYTQPKTYLRKDQTKEQKLFDEANDLLIDFANGKKRPKKSSGTDKNGNKYKLAEYKGQWIAVYYDKNGEISEIHISHRKNVGPDGDIAEVIYNKNKANYSFNADGHYEGSIDAWQFEWEKLKKIAEAIFR